ARGPKPAAALREMNVPVAVTAPEPNTWRELVAAIEGRPERSIAVQEYGRSNPELLAALRGRGPNVTPVRLYHWDFPEDLEPLREAARRLARGEFQVAMFTTAIQISHLFRVARDLGIEDAAASQLRKAVIASIGPTTSEALEEFGIIADLEPSRPKMGFLVQETAQRVQGLRQGKQA